jgi:uncharacterized protein YukE
MSSHIKMDFDWTEGLIAQMGTTRDQFNEQYTSWNKTADEAYATWPDGVGSLFNESKQILQRTSDELQEALTDLTTAVRQAKAAMEEGYSAAKGLWHR